MVVRVGKLTVLGLRLLRGGVGLMRNGNIGGGSWNSGGVEVVLVGTAVGGHSVVGDAVVKRVLKNK